MSFLSDLQSILSKEDLRSKLTLDERAKLLYDITCALDWECYEKFDEKGSWIGPNVELARQDLERYDEEDKRMMENYKQKKR